MGRSPGGKLIVTYDKFQIPDFWPLLVRRLNLDQEHAIRKSEVNFQERCKGCG